MRKLRKIVFSGAPSSGKSSVLAELQKKKRHDIILVPESAVLLLSGGYPAPDLSSLEQMKAFQGIIIQVQRSLENIFELKFPNACHMILDRAVLDGPAYWAPGIEDYYKTFGINLQEELSNYDAVVFFETPDSKFFGGTHEGRFHNYEQSAEIGTKQELIWSQHPRFYRVPAKESFSEKVKFAVELVGSIINGH